ncbi:MAG: hypothetical protein AAF671_13080 [Pseudomonadota bacterium]
MTNRPANPPKITQADMCPGDVILSRSGPSDGMNELLDKLILAIDQGDYTHSSLWDGQYVIEALTNGVQIHDSLELTLHDQELVDVYRPKFFAVASGDGALPPEPVLTAARSFEGYAYGYTKLVLAGLVLLTSEIPEDPVIEVALRIFSSLALARLEKFLKDEHSMICSEVVTQAFYDGVSDPEHQYGLSILIGDHHHIQINPEAHAKTLAAALETTNAEHARASGVATGLLASEDATPDSRLSEFHAVRARLAEIYPKHVISQLNTVTSPGMRSATVIGGSPILPAAFVTPGDLQRSPTLELVGTLKQPGTH